MEAERTLNCLLIPPLHTLFLWYWQRGWHAGGEIRRAQGQVVLVWIGDEEQRGRFVVSMRCRVGGETEAGGGGCREVGELRPRSAMVAARE